MRRHHEEILAAPSILSALSLLLPVAGALWAMVHLGSWEPLAFDVNRSFQLLFMVIIGGAGKEPDPYMLGSGITNSALLNVTKALSIELGPDNVLIFACGVISGAPVAGSSCRVFPADNVWNVPVAGLPVAGNSATMIGTVLL